MTEAVPNLLQWHTNNSHYMNTAKQAGLHNLSGSFCSLLGESSNDSVNNVQGYMPVKSELQSVIKRDLVLIGQLEFHDKGFTFTDERLGMFIVPFASVRKLTFHMDNNREEDWLEVTMN